MKKKEAIESDISNINIGEKIPLEEFRKLLKAEDEHLTDDEVLIIRDFVYKMATIEYLYFTEEYLPKKREQLKQKADENTETEKGKEPED